MSKLEDGAAMYAGRRQTADTDAATTSALTEWTVADLATAMARGRAQAAAHAGNASARKALTEYARAHHTRDGSAAAAGEPGEPDPLR
jgi:hypothetical protein